MSRRNAPEFYWSEKRQQYRKRLKDPNTGTYADVWGSTKEECRRKVREKEAEFAEGIRREECPYFAEYAAEWYALHAPLVGSKMRQNYRTAINRHICPVLGGKLLRDISTDDTQAVMTYIGDKSHETQKRTLSIMRRIFQAAVSAGKLSADPCRELKARGAPPSEKIPLTKAQQETLISSLGGHRCQIFCALCLYAGLRREEALGLQWNSVHLNREVPFLQVSRALRWEGNAAVVNEKLKSRAAKRKIPIAPPLLAILRQAKENAIGMYVVENAGGEPMSCGAFRRMWKAVLMRSEREFHYQCNGREYSRFLKVGDRAPYTGTVVAIDFDVQPHQLRHTFITELILSGANIKKVQYLAGHSDVRITLQIYAHLMENTPEDTLEAVSKAFGEGSV